MAHAQMFERHSGERRTHPADLGCITAECNVACDGTMMGLPPGCKRLTNGAGRWAVLEASLSRELQSCTIVLYIAL